MNTTKQQTCPACGLEQNSAEAAAIWKHKANPSKEHCLACNTPMNKTKQQTKHYYDSLCGCWDCNDKRKQTGKGNVPRVLKLKTFDKHQGWQTLEVFSDFELASKRAQEILASNPLWTVNNLRIVDEIA